MTNYVFTPPPVPSLEVTGTKQHFPVRRVFCVGRNYAAHAREMGRDPDREPPFFFLKPGDAVVSSGAKIPYPPETENLQHEIELVAAIGREGFRVAEEDAPGLVFGYASGLDLTRRDLQLKAREAGRPWDWGKGFDRSAPCAAIVPVGAIGHPDHGRVWLEVNGELRQEGDLKELIWSVPEVISIISQSMRLAPGDLVFTGTPAGVGVLWPGDVVNGGVQGVGEITVTIADPE